MKNYGMENSNKMISKILLTIRKVVERYRRNNIILFYVNYPAKKKRINLNWAPLPEIRYGGFVFKKDTAKQNLGDYLANPIYEYMLERFQLDEDKKTTKTIHLYTVGSIILLGHQDAVVWGSGLLRTDPPGYVWKRTRYRKLDIRCVRGPETKRRLEENGYDVSNCVFGDPGVLMPLIYTPKEGEKKDYSVVYHMSYVEECENGIDILTDDWKRTIDEIYNSRLVISSSLHGIILAEAYGVPAILLKNEKLDVFKYNDYYYSTGRYEYPMCATIEEALSIEVPEVPDLSELRNNLLRSFPVDLWR